LADQGVKLALVARGKEELERVAAEIRATHGRDYPVVALAADVSDKQAVYPLAARAAQAIGPVDLLIHNASQLGTTPLQLLMDTDCEELESVLQTNVVGPFRLTKALAGPMLLRGHGLIVSISSDAAVEAYPRWGGYSVSKAASDHLTRILGAELADTGVRLLSIDPGEMDTRMHSDAIPDADPRTLADPMDVARRIVSIVSSAREIPSGSRLVASRWEISQTQGVGSPREVGYL
jgi:NAD(P)-dependent dehydrogenase (short-subunit alcohol dehydrogenase family)